MILKIKKNGQIFIYEGEIFKGYMENVVKVNVEPIRNSLILKNEKGEPVITLHPDKIEFE